MLGIETLPYWDPCSLPTSLNDVESLFTLIIVDFRNSHKDLDSTDIAHWMTLHMSKNILESRSYSP